MNFSSNCCPIPLIRQMWLHQTSVPKLKKFLDKIKFSLTAEVIAAAESFFEELEEMIYNDGITVMEKPVDISVKGDYVKK